MKTPFWKTTPLHRMTALQWEWLCDGCALCCLQKVQDRSNGRVHYTAIACRFLDVHDCRCTVYAKRQGRNPRCVILTPQNLGAMHWLPETCAYRRVANGKGLNTWHPLISGDPSSVHRAGISVRDKVISGTHIHPDDLKWLL